ncbi:MAG: hypothetical protein AB1777_09400 [Bacteroidota bacterium]
MVKLRHPIHNNKLNELNRLIWLGLLLLISGTAAILIATNFLREPLLIAKNSLLVALLSILLIFYLYHIVSVARKQFKSTNRNGNQK